MQNIKKYFMTLALLIAAVTGAWAQSTEPTEWELTSKDGKNWILDKMPASNIELQVEYYAESNLFLSKEALADKANIAVKNGETAVTFDDAGKSTTTVTEGNTVTVTYTGSKKVIGVKAEKKAAEPVADIVWDATNVFNSAHQFEEVSPWNSDHLTYEGITISFSGDDSMFRPYGGMGESMLLCYGEEGESFTFTAPSGKKFYKIEIINNDYVVFDKYGDWTQPEDNKIVWSGTAANAVTLGTVYTAANKLNSIAFYLSK